MLRYDHSQENRSYNQIQPEKTRPYSQMGLSKLSGSHQDPSIPACMSLLNFHADQDASLILPHRFLSCQYLKLSWLQQKACHYVVN